MDNKKAIEVVKSNYPDRRYSTLREALDYLIEQAERAERLSVKYRYERDTRVPKLEKEIKQLQYQKDYFEKDNERHLDTLADVRDELLDFVNVDNPCNDMLACTVSNPDCISCMAKNIKGVIEHLQKEVKEWEQISDKQVQHLIRNEKEIMSITEENEQMKQYIKNGIEFGYIDDREEDYKKFISE
jgi:hypothetical protein